MKSCYQGYTSERIDTNRDVWDVLRAAFSATNDMISEANKDGRVITGVRFHRCVDNLTNQWDDGLNVLVDVKNEDAVA